MFPQQPQQQFRTAGADVQIFYGSSRGSVRNQQAWNKPVGVSHIYMMLIGGGGPGDSVNAGGGSGAVTVWYGAAQNVPNSLVISAAPSQAGSSFMTTVSARFSDSSALPTALLTASSTTTTSGGAAMIANQFTASGFFQSVAGQDGLPGGVGASTTTFLSGGGAGGNNQDGNYGYSQPSATNLNGFFMLQPVIVGVGSTGSFRGATGCGGGFSGGGGGPGMVLIASW